MLYYIAGLHSLETHKTQYTFKSVLDLNNTKVVGNNPEVNPWLLNN